MLKAVAIARREFLERVRTRWFLVSTLLVPVLMAASIILPVVVTDASQEPLHTLVVDGTTTGLGTAVATELNHSGAFATQVMAGRAGPTGRAADSLSLLVELNYWDIVLELDDAAVDEARFDLLADRKLSGVDERLLESALRGGILQWRMMRAGIDSATAFRLSRAVSIDPAVVVARGTSTREEQLGALVLGYLMWLVLYMAILIYGMSVMTSVVEEKTSHIVEVLISSVRPVELLAGKIVGVGAVGLFQMAIWSLAFAIFAMLLGGGSVDATGAPELVFPEVGLSDGAVLLVYFLLGYLLYAALFAAAGSTVGSESEARQAQFPVILLLVVPTLLLPAVVSAPDGQLAAALAFIPFSSPVIMPVLWRTGAMDRVDVVVSVAVLLVSCVGVTIMAAKVYRVCILTAGSRPGLRELLRWIGAA